MFYQLGELRFRKLYRYPLLGLVRFEMQLLLSVVGQSRCGSTLVRGSTRFCLVGAPEENSD
jgi:hypothetical protein